MSEFWKPLSIIPLPDLTVCSTGIACAVQQSSWHFVIIPVLQGLLLVALVLACMCTAASLAQVAQEGFVLGNQEEDLEEDKMSDEWTFALQSISCVCGFLAFHFSVLNVLSPNLVFWTVLSWVKATVHL